jgi:hypothetical protein
MPNCKRAVRVEQLAISVRKMIAATWVRNPVSNLSGLFIATISAIRGLKNVLVAKKKSLDASGGVHPTLGPSSRTA